MSRAALIVIAAALSSCAPNFSEQPTAEEVLSALDKPWIGRAGIEESFTREGNVEEAILAGICTASPHWLEVARRMADTGNAHWSEEMSSALAVALTRQPEFVLEHFEYMCHEPEDDLPDSCYMPKWRDDVQAALRTVKAATLAAKRDQCAIDAAHTGVPSNADKQ